jgi:uroporphyrinogen decarboxylase
MQALRHESCDRVPIDYWADILVSDRLIRRLHLRNQEELLVFLKADIRYIEGSVYIGPELEKYEDGSVKDIWGVRRKKIYVDPGKPGKGMYEHVICHPLADAETIRDIENYPGFASPDWYDYSHVEEAANVHTGYAVACGGDRLNRTAQLKPTMYLRGVEQTMVDLAWNPKLIEAINDRLIHYYLEYNRRIFEKAQGAIDLFFMGDDFGTQNGLMMSPDTWRRLYKPGFTQFIALAHRYGMKVMHHTCGGVFELIPDFIECGLDILQSLQPQATGMDFAKIKKMYGKDICFQGGIDIQGVMPFGTPDEVQREAYRVLQELSCGGGYIFGTAHNIQADTPDENVLALYQAVLQFNDCP